VIRLDNISKQHGPQILFIETSAAILRGEKIGLVGPNGAGKSTVFRLIMGEESPDEGQISIDRNVTIGHFSQDVGEMKGVSAVGATMDGAGPVSALATEMRELEHAMADPARAHELDTLVDRFGHVQARFDELGGYALEARAREIMAGLGFSQEMMDGDVGNLSGGWKMRVALARILLMRPNVMLLDEPLGHRIHHLAGRISQELRRRSLDDYPRSRVHEPRGQQDHRDRWRRAHHLFGQLRFLRKAARLERDPSRGGLCAPAGHAGQGDPLHRAVQGAGQPCGAGPVAGEEAGQDRKAATRSALPFPRRRARARTQSRSRACTSSTDPMSSTTDSI
jgi:ABC-type dipeptide/oligopeptide/nickel transport system ATPase subunit